MKKHLLFITLSFSGMYGFSQKLEKIEKLIIDGHYINPLVSPTGQYALLTGQQFTGVYLLDMRSKKTTQLSKAEGSGYAYCWSKSGDVAYFKEKKENGYVSNSEVRSYNINTKATQTLYNINHNVLPSYSGNENEIVIYTNIATLKIEAKNLKTSETWIITKEEGQFYNAILSHNKKKMVVNCGPDLFIYTIDGSEKPKKIGQGIASDWSNDDKYIVGYLDESADGHEITNSDIYLYNATTLKTQKLTQTKNIFEKYPSFFGNDKIIFSDDNTGQLFISTIKL